MFIHREPHFLYFVLLFPSFKFILSLAKNIISYQKKKKKEFSNFYPDAIPLAVQNLLCENNDFPPRAHCLVRWWVGLVFMVLNGGYWDLCISKVGK